MNYDTIWSTYSSLNLVQDYGLKTPIIEFTAFIMSNLVVLIIYFFILKIHSIE